MLTLADREEISRCLAVGMEQKDIAVRIGRHPSVVSREIGRHGGRRAYRAHPADAGAGKSRRRPNAGKTTPLPAFASGGSVTCEKPGRRSRSRAGWAISATAGRRV